MKRKYLIFPSDQGGNRFKVLRVSVIDILEDKRPLGDKALPENNKIIAYGALYGLKIRALFAHSTVCGKGAGMMLSEFLLSNITRVKILCVAKINSPARHFYERYGFKIVNEFQTEYNSAPALANEMVHTNGV